MNKAVILISLMILLAAAFSETAYAQNQAEGKNLYANYCATCHGDQGKGDGPAARALPARPADHTNGAIMNKFNDKFLLDVITKGGSAVGKSSFMPSWGGSFNEKQIRDIVAFIRTIAVPAYKPEAPSNK